MQYLPQFDVHGKANAALDKQLKWTDCEYMNFNTIYQFFSVINLPQFEI